MTLTMPNLPLLRKAVKWVETEAARPEKERGWLQAMYAVEGELIYRTCDYAYCVAGYVRSLYDGPMPLWADRAKTGRIAAELLGISALDHNAGWGLFATDNSARDVRRIAEEIAASVGETL